MAQPTMQAAWFDAYGTASQVRIAHVPKPQVSNGTLLVRVLASCVSAADSRIRAARFPRGFGVLGRLAFGLRSPRQHILGGCYSGVVEAVGSNVHGLAVGTRLCGMTGMALGCHAEYVVVQEGSAYAIVPDAVTHQQAAGIVFGGTTAMYFLRDVAKVQAGERVLVIGASGAVGAAAVQLARIMGATVTAVTSGANASLMRELGAHTVIDYKAVNLANINETYNVVLDTVGNVKIASGRKLLATNGRLVLAAATLGQMVAASGIRGVYSSTAPERASDIAELLSLVSTGQLRTIIDAIVPLSAIASAHQRVDTGRKVGNLVVDMA